MARSAQTGFLLAPDKISIWPVEGDRFGIDGTYQGASGFERAEAQRRRLHSAELTASIREELGDAWTLRLGPLTHAAAWLAIEAFIGPAPASGAAGS